MHWNTNKLRTFNIACAVIVVVYGLAGCTTGMPVAQVAQFMNCHEYHRTHEGIIGGEAVGYGDPDQKIVTLLRIRHDDHESVCTGTLISDQVVLTAAHCIEGIQPKNITAQFETTSHCPVNQIREAVAEVTKTVSHKKFDGTPQSLADVALVYLSEEAPRDQQRIPLIAASEKPTSDRLLLIGFGITGETKKDSQVLRRIYKSLKQDVTYRDHSLIVNQMSGSGGFCRGDSGAPILAEVWGEPRIIGVNSANIGAQENTECQTLSLAMDAVSFSDWIDRNRKNLESSTWISRLFSEPVEKAN